MFVHQAIFAPTSSKCIYELLWARCWVADLYSLVGIYYFDFDNIYPVSNKTHHCSFLTLSNVFAGVGGDIYCMLTIRWIWNLVNLRNSCTLRMNSHKFEKNTAGSSECWQRHLFSGFRGIPWLNLQWNQHGKLHWAERVWNNTELGVKVHFCLADQCSLECVCVCVSGGHDSLFTAWWLTWPPEVGKYEDSKSIVEGRYSALTVRGGSKALVWKRRSPSQHTPVRTIKWSIDP